jgi:Transposase, Mutator family
VVQEVLEAEMSEAFGAQKGERTPVRMAYRSGYYVRSLVTRVGKHRDVTLRSTPPRAVDLPAHLGSLTLLVGPERWSFVALPRATPVPRRTAVRNTI